MYSLSAINVVSQESVSRFVNVLWILLSCFPPRQRTVDTVREREDGMNWESNYLPDKNFKSVFTYLSTNARDVQIYKHMHCEPVETLANDAIIPFATHIFSCEAFLI